MTKSSTFSDNITEVETIIEKLESGDVSLEETIDLYKSGMEIIKDCSKKIDKIEKELKVIKENKEEA